MASVIQDDRAYRRGLVLGLTMAEIAILLIFCLLLALAALLLTKDKEIEAARAEREVLSADKAALQKKLDLALSVVPSEDNFNDRFQELTLALEKLEKLESERPALVEKARAYEEIEQVLKDAGREPGPEQMRQVMSEIKALNERTAEIEAAQEVREALERAGLPTRPAELQKALPDAMNLQSENQRLRAENERQEARLSQLDKDGEGVGKGTEMPSCWFDPATEKTEFIFDVALTSSGLIVRDRAAAPHHAAEKERLPIEITFDKDLSPAAFLRQAQPLFEWSVENECRFFVLAFDLTAPHEKELFKQRLLTLERRFYKQVVQNDPW